MGLLAANGKVWWRLIVGLVAGLAVIHLGGIAQLAVVSGGLSQSVALGSLPFLPGDLLKLVVAGLVVRRFASQAGALL